MKNKTFWYLFAMGYVFSAVFSSATVFGATKFYNSYRIEGLAPFPREPGVGGAIIGTDAEALLVAGGANFPEKPWWEGGAKHYSDHIDVLIRDPDGSARWIDVPQRLPRAMGYAAVVSSPYGIVSLGGETADGILDDAMILRFHPVDRSVSFKTLPKLPKRLYAASASLLGRRVYCLGGFSDGFSSAEMYSLDLETPGSTWRREPDLPRPVAFAVCVTQSDGENDCLYLFGGRIKQPEDEITRYSEAVYSFDPKDGRWREETPLPMTLSAGCGAPLGISSVFLFGGDDGEVFNADERRKNAIERETDAKKRETLIAERKRFLENHQGFRRELFLYNTITRTWTVPFELPKGSKITTGVVPWNNGKTTGFAIPSGETRPSTRTTDVDLIRIESRSGFAGIDYGILALYMIGLLGLGFLFMRRDGTTDDFFLGGGRLPWWAVGISIFATTVSAITFLTFPAKAYMTDWRMSPYNFGTLLAAPIIIRFYLPYFHNLKLDTAYDYLERRFNRIVRYLASGLFVVFMISRIAIILFLPALALNVATGIDVYLCILAMSVVTIIYCTLGGVEAVVWGDVVQGFILAVGAILSLVVLILCSENGVAGAFTASYEFGKLHLFDFRFDWTEPVFWVVILGSFSNNIITYSSDQTHVQRYMCVKSEKQTARSIWLNALLIVGIIFIFFPIGTALFTYYRSNPELMDAGLRNADAIYPLFIVNGLPPGISGFVVAAIFAAAMSTLSANINSVSAAVYADFIKQWFPGFAARHSVRISRTVGVLAGILGTALALSLVTWNVRSYWDQFNAFLGLFTGPVGGLFLMGVFSKRIHAGGAIAGLFASVLMVWSIQLLTSVSILLYGFIGMATCYLVGYVVSLIFPSSKEVFLHIDTERDS